MAGKKKFTRKNRVVATKLTKTINPYVEPVNAKFVKSFSNKGFSYSAIVNGLIQRQRTGKAVTVNGKNGDTFRIK